MRLDDDDKLAGVAWIPAEVAEEAGAELPESETDAPAEPDDSAAVDS